MQNFRKLQWIVAEKIRTDGQTDGHASKHKSPSESQGTNNNKLDKETKNSNQIKEKPNTQTHKQI